MTDNQIIELYWARNEDAIQETDMAYGRKLHTLADKIVQNHEDAQECVSDTYFKTWETIPPQRPSYFFAYLAKICRNLPWACWTGKVPPSAKAKWWPCRRKWKLVFPTLNMSENWRGKNWGKF